MFGSQEQTREEAIYQAVPDPSSSVPPAGSQGIYPTLPESPPPSGTTAIPQASHTEIPANDDPLLLQQQRPSQHHHQTHNLSRQRAFRILNPR